MIWGKNTDFSEKFSCRSPTQPHSLLIFNRKTFLEIIEEQRDPFVWTLRINILNFLNCIILLLPILLLVIEKWWRRFVGTLVISTAAATARKEALPPSKKAAWGSPFLQRLDTDKYRHKHKYKDTMTSTPNLKQGRH